MAKVTSSPSRQENSFEKGIFVGTLSAVQTQLSLLLLLL